MAPPPPWPAEAWPLTSSCRRGERRRLWSRRTRGEHQAYAGSPGAPLCHPRRRRRHIHPDRNPCTTPATLATLAIRALAAGMPKPIYPRLTAQRIVQYAHFSYIVPHQHVFCLRLLSPWSPTTRGAPHLLSLKQPPLEKTPPTHQNLSISSVFPC